MDQICQIMILILGGLTILLIAQKKNKYKRVGFIIGLISEIFWFITSWMNNQWGIFMLAFVYSGCYFLGIINHWRKDER